MSPRTPLDATDSSPAPADSGATSAATSEAVEQVFLSPRVVDRRAFTELATELRRLVEKAAGERTALGAALDQAAESTRALRDSETSQQDNLELTARALKRLDDRIATATELLEQTSDANRLIEKFQGRADQILAERIEAMEARLAAAQAGAAAKVEALEQRLRSAARDMEQRIEVVQRDAEGAVGPGIAALNLAVTNASAVLGRSPTAPADSPAAKNSLQDLVQRAEAAHAGAEAAVRQLETIQERASGSRATFASLLEELSALITRVDVQRAGLVEDNRKLCRECADASATLEQRLTETRREADGAIAEIKPRAQAAAADAARSLEELRELVRRAADAHNTTSVVLRLADRSGAQISAAIASLEPWRKVLLETDASAGLPGPINAIVETVRREFTTDLAGIARALEAAAAGARRAADRAAEIDAADSHLRIHTRSSPDAAHAAD